jgi:hypothetical protein
LPGDGFAVKLLPKKYKKSQAEESGFFVGAGCWLNVECGGLHSIGLAKVVP